MSRIITLIETIALALLGGLRALYFKARTRPLEAEAILVVLILIFAAIGDTGLEPKPSDGRIMVSGDELQPTNLEETFLSLGYTLDTVRDGEAAVPRIIVSSLPNGLKNIRVIDRRKRLFFRLVLPLILTVNEDITKDRARLHSMDALLNQENSTEQNISEKNEAWIKGLAERYDIDPVEDDLSQQDLINVLKVRVAPIPVSLALAQAVEESAWGTSRFAREGNALYGQWVWNEDAGIVPTDQREGQAYAVRAFATPLNSVRAYAKNLNTHWAYASFREQRAEMLNTTGTADGWTLAQTLTQYSERREAYVKSLHAIMRVNRLRSLDDATLASPDAMKELMGTS